jgi:two-component system OmpR family response regulator
MNSYDTCLVVENDRDVRDLLFLILTGADFKPGTEAAGTEGLQAARMLDRVLSSLDVGPPGISGHEVAQHLCLQVFPTQTSLARARS